MERPSAITKAREGNTSQIDKSSIHSANTQGIDDANLEKNSHSANEEAVEIYGDVGAAAHYGYVERGSV